MMYHEQRPAYNITTKLFLILVNDSIFIFRSHDLDIPKLYHIHLADSIYIAHNGFFLFVQNQTSLFLLTQKYILFRSLNLRAPFTNTF